jgi:hypothetical protein
MRKTKLAAPFSTSGVSIKKSAKKYLEKLVGVMAFSSRLTMKKNMMDIILVYNCILFTVCY